MSRIRAVLAVVVPLAVGSLSGCRGDKIVPITDHDTKLETHAPAADRPAPPPLPPEAPPVVSATAAGSATAAPRVGRAEADAVLAELRALAKVGDDMRKLRRPFDEAERSSAAAASQAQCVRMMRDARDRVAAVRERAQRIDAAPSLGIAAAAMNGFLTCTDVADEMGGQVREALADAAKEIAKAKW